MPRPATLLKIDSGIDFSYEFFEICKNILLHRTPLVAASVHNIKIRRSAVLFVIFISKPETSWSVQPLGICAVVLFDNF